MLFQQRIRPIPIYLRHRKARRPKEGKKQQPFTIIPVRCCLLPNDLRSDVPLASCVCNNFPQKHILTRKKRLSSSQAGKCHIPPHFFVSQMQFPISASASQRCDIPSVRTAFWAALMDGMHYTVCVLLIQTYGSPFAGHRTERVEVKFHSNMFAFYCKDMAAFHQRCYVTFSIVITNRKRGKNLATLQHPRALLDTAKGRT